MFSFIYIAFLSLCYSEIIEDLLFASYKSIEIIINWWNDEDRVWGWINNIIIWVTQSTENQCISYTNFKKYHSFKF